MSSKIPIKLLQSLRHEVASVISDFKAYDVPGVATRLGLAEGTEEEAFQSKYKYASSRLVSVDGAQLLQIAHKLLDEVEAFRLKEIVGLIDDADRSSVTKLTRRRLLKLIDQPPIVTEIEEYEFVSTVFPLAQMTAPGSNDDRSLEEYFLQHTIRNDDLTHQEYLEALGLLTCSTRLLFHFLEQLTSAEYQSEERQQELATQIDALLRHDGYSLSVSGKVSGSPIYKVRSLPDANPADLDITATLQAFDPDQIAARWQGALESRSSDPERAITLARTLLEDVCKWILNEAGETWEEKDDLPALYKKLSKTLNLAPDGHTEQIFKQILSGCQSVVTALGSLRNKLMCLCFAIAFPSSIPARIDDGVGYSV